MQAEVPFRPGVPAGARRDAQILQKRKLQLRAAAVLQRLPLQTVLRHTWLILPGEIGLLSLKSLSHIVR